jgi:hypothetical protein
MRGDAMILDILDTKLPVLPTLRSLAAGDGGTAMPLPLPPSRGGDDKRDVDSGDERRDVDKCGERYGDEGTSASRDVENRCGERYGDEVADVRGERIKCEE